MLLHDGLDGGDEVLDIDGVLLGFLSTRGDEAAGDMVGVFELAAGFGVEFEADWAGGHF